MKRVFVLVLFFISFQAAVNAQTGKANEAKPAVPQTLKTATGKAGKLKKDGTLDMRYKENQEAAKVAPKIKKDGTPDMRYKRNKKSR